VTICWYGSAHLFENVGTPAAPSWSEQIGAFDGISVGTGGTEPSLADINGDGDLDLLAAIDRVLVVIENVGTPSVAAWTEWVLVPGVEFDSGVSASADLGDMDGDGDLDIVGVTWDTPPQCWENVGTPAVAVFQENPDMLTGVDAPAPGYGIELLDVDGDTDLDLLISRGLSGNALYLQEQITPTGTSTWGRIKALYR
jgi:hypothetical protein